MSRKKIKDIERNLSKIGLRLLSLEKLFRINQAELSRKIGITSGYITEIKYGRSTGGMKFWDGIRREFPQWEDYLQLKTDEPPSLKSLFSIGIEDIEGKDLVEKIPDRFAEDFGRLEGEIKSKCENILSEIKTFMEKGYGDHAKIKSMIELRFRKMDETLKTMSDKLSTIEYAMSEHRPPPGVEERRKLWKEFAIN